jgi:hypothetical protein
MTRSQIARSPDSASLSPVDRDEILRVLRAFEAAGFEYVLIGG